jgi:AcrR family transcriptional regulator
VPPETKRATQSRTPRGAAERQILDAVERLLSQGESYTALGMRRIADEAGVARSTMYVYFTDKSELLMRITESATAELFTVAEEWVASGRDGGLDAIEKVQLAIIEQQRSHGALLAAVLEVAAYDAAVADFWRTRVNAFAAKLQESIEREQRAGRTPADLDAEVAARFLTWGTERTVFEHTSHPGGMSDERLAMGMAQVIWAATRAGP